MLKINVDDSTRQDNACVVVICKDSQGRVKPAAIVRVATTDSEHAEAHTILLGLKIAAHPRDTSYIIIIDAKSLIHCICSKAQCFNGELRMWYTSATV